VGSIWQFSKKLAICSLVESLWYGSIWNPDTPFKIISAGPPSHVTNVGRPHVIASTTYFPSIPKGIKT